jgi:hypothetical protein
VEIVVVNSLYNLYEQFLNWISDIINNLILTKDLHFYEKLVLDSWSGTLKDNVKSVLDSQFKTARHVQRGGGDAKIIFFYPKDVDCRRLLIDENFKNGLVAKVMLAAHGTEKTLEVRIYIHKGKLFSIEFPGRPKYYMKKRNMDVNKLYVKDVKTIQEVRVQGDAIE